MLELFVAHGEVLFAGLVVAGALLAGAASRIAQAYAARRRWRALTGGAMAWRGPRLEPGTTALAGRIDAHGARVAACSVTARGSDAAIHARRAPRLTLRTSAGDVELEGPVHVVVGAGARERCAPELLADTLEGLLPEEAQLFEGLPLDVREARDAEEVLVFGRLERTDARASSYRSAASRWVLRAPDDHEAVLVATGRRRGAAWAASIGALLAFALVAITARPDGWSAASLMAPWTRPRALDDLRSHLSHRVRDGSASPHEAELFADHLAPKGLERARALALAGRRAEARREAVRGHHDPFVRADGLVAIGLGAEAIEELRRVHGPEARAREVIARVGLPRWRWDRRSLAAALDATCGSDWTCAADPVLLWGAHAPHGEPDVDRLLAGWPPSVTWELAEVMLRVAGDESVGDPRIARCRIRWLIDHAANQMRIGALDESRKTLARARRSIERWPRHTLDLARAVDHFEAAAALFAHLQDPESPAPALPASHEDPDCSMQPWLALVLEPAAADPDALPSSVAGAWRSRGALPLDSASDVMALAWVAPLLDPAERDVLAARYRESGWHPTHGSDVDRLFARAVLARALRRLGYPSTRLEAEVRNELALRYAW